MPHLTLSGTHPGKWLLGERELAHGEVIEVLLLGKWYRATVCYDMGLREYRLLLDGHTHTMPIPADLPARWPTSDRPMEAKADSPAG
jgi:hypothetical protein